jgi:Flp pilus assembly protein TadG
LHDFSFCCFQFIPSQTIQSKVCSDIRGEIEDNLSVLNKYSLTMLTQRYLIGRAYHNCKIFVWGGSISMVRKLFFGDIKGNMSIMMAVAALPLLAAAGAAIDMVHANNAQTALQSAVDAAALAGGTSGFHSHADLSALVNKYLAENNANFSIGTADTIDFGTTPVTNNFFVRVNGTVKTDFMSLVGIPSMGLGAYAEVEKGGQALELALVLDNTASMNSEGRLAALKISAKKLVDTVMTNKPAGAYVKIGIVPFSNYVNVGMGNRNKSWIDVPADYTDTTAVTYNSYPNPTNCHIVDHPYLNDGVPAVWQENVCDWGAAVPVSYFPTHTWNGCVGSRNDPLDVSIASPNVKYPGIMDVGCPQPLTDLTDTQSTLNSQIDAMVATGETYIPSGVLWGWNMLDSQQPITGAKTAAEMANLKGVKAMVLMTDGDNTLSATYPTHNGSDSAAADAKTAQLCANMKADGISIFTVGFKVNKASSLAMLAACASNSSQALTADNDAALLAAFDQIGASLAQIRVSK